MGFRFRRQIKIFPGIRINVSKNHFISSITIGGVKNLLKTNIPVGRDGNAKTTLGNFGGLLTGLSYQHEHQNTSRRRRSQASTGPVDADSLRSELARDQQRRLRDLEEKHRKRLKGL